jgi:hypothetical protein
MENTETMLPARITSYDSATEPQQKRSSFIEANTVKCDLDEIRKEHIIPVFVKDNETLVSHVEFIQAAEDVASTLFRGETIITPEIRLSHPIKGRVPEAKDKQAKDLLPWEKTLYYERMAFAIEIPSIQSEIDGNLLSLTLGGVKSFAEDNLYNRSKSDQHFKLFVGFQNKVCTNMCVWSDRYVDSVRVRSTGMLKAAMIDLLSKYNEDKQLKQMQKWVDYSLTEEQFAQIVGKCRMFQYLPNEVRKTIPAMLFGDQQMGAVVRDFYRDQSFCKDSSGNINLWKLYNLFTGVNKSSYIDSFLDRSVNAFSITEEVRSAIDGKYSWYLN